MIVHYWEFCPSDPLSQVDVVEQKSQDISGATDTIISTKDSTGLGSSLGFQR